MADLAGNSILKRIGKGLGGLSLNALVSILGQIAIVPIAMHTWGKIRYGEWVTISGLVLLLKLSDLGLQTYVVNRMCEAYVRGEREALQRILSSSVKIQLVLIVSLFSLLAITLLIIRPEIVFNLRTVGRAEATTACLCLSTELLLGVPMGVIAGMYRATGRLPRAAMIGAGQQGILLALTFILIALNMSFAVVAALRLLAIVFCILFVLRDLKRFYPWINLSPWQGSWEEGVKMIMPGLFFLAVPLADYLANQVTLVLLQKQLGGAEVSRFATHRTAVNLAQMVSGLLTSAVWPEITSLYAAGYKSQLATLYRGMVKFNLGLVIVITFGLLPFLPLIYSSWTAGHLVLDYMTLAFLILRVVAWGFWNVSATLLYAINHQKLVATIQFGGALVTSILAFFLIPQYGISGAALATCLSDLAICAWIIPYLTARTIGDSGSLYWSKAVFPILLSLTLPVVLGYLAWAYFDLALLRYLVILPLALLLGLLLSWLALTHHERVLILKISQRFHQRVFA